MRMGTRAARVVAIVGVVGLVAALALLGRLATSGAPTTTSPDTSPGAATSITWKTVKRTLPDGRTFFVRGPVCTPASSATCVDYLGRKRTLVIFLHGATGAEDRETASSWLQGMRGWSPETLFVFGVSKDDTKVWDAGLCCTTEPVDDVGYLTRVVGNVGKRWPVDTRRVGVEGLSNGGMLALRATCERPDVFRAAAALSGIYDGACDAGVVRIGQWHGALDETVPLEGGTVTINGVPRTMPPVTSLAQRMAPKSRYELRVIPGRGHTMTWEDHRRATLWLISHLPK